jgi:hypothetical protein
MNATLASSRKIVSANAYAKEFFRLAIETGKQEVTNIDLQRFVHERTGQTRAVINGTLDGTGPGTLVDSPWYTTAWYKNKLPNGRVTHQRQGDGKDAVVQREKNYNHPNKREACNQIMANLPTSGRPRVLTMASSYGNCVQAALARNPRAVIDNIECRPEVLQLWRARKAQLGIETTDYCCTLQDFVRAPGFAQMEYALFNADAMGYAGQVMFDYLSAVNAAKNCKIVAVTTQRLNGFRNHGAFVESLRAKYAGQVDAHAACIADWLHNYTMIDRCPYTKDDYSRWMEFFVFQLDA